MSPSSQSAGDFFDLIGRLRRSANTSARFGQMDELQRIADGLVRWQARVRTDICRALDINPPTSVSIETMVERIRNEHTRAEAVPEGLLRAYRAANEDAPNGVSAP